MPRKPPQALRRPQYEPGPHARIDGLSERAHAAVRHVEEVHFRPGETAYSLAVYRELLDRPGRWLPGDAVISPGLEPEAARTALQDILDRLPPAPRRELDLLLEPLDRDYMRRTLPGHGEHPVRDQRWRWRDREL